MGGGLLQLLGFGAWDLYFTSTCEEMEGAQEEGNEEKIEECKNKLIALLKIERDSFIEKSNKEMDKLKRIAENKSE